MYKVEVFLFCLTMEIFKIFTAKKRMKKQAMFPVRRDGVKQDMRFKAPHVLCISTPFPRKDMRFSSSLLPPSKRQSN